MLEVLLATRKRLTKAVQASDFDRDHRPPDADASRPSPGDAAEPMGGPRSRPRADSPAPIVLESMKRGAQLAQQAEMARRLGNPLTDVTQAAGVVGPSTIAPLSTPTMRPVESVPANTPYPSAGDR